MSNHVISPEFIADVARFGGTPSQLARLRARSGSGGPQAPQEDHSAPLPYHRDRTWDRFLLWLAGVNYDLASRSYVDRTRHATVGFAVLVTALTAGVSFFLVLSSAGVNIPLSVLATAAGMALIITLERSLVASATRRFGSFGKAMITTAASLVIALLLATVVAQPLMLRLFQPEIQQQVQASRLHETQRFYSGQIDSPVLNGLAVKVRESQRQLVEAEEYLRCEVSGNCGTGTPGTGVEAREREAELRQARTEYQQVRSQYDAAVREIQLSATQLNARPVGLVEQFRAFSEVSAKEPAVKAASYLTTGMFVLVEMLPLLLVVMTRRRGATLYEKLLAIQERYAQDEYELDAVRRAGARRLKDDTDPEVDDVLRRFEQQRDEMGQVTRATVATVIQLSEKRAARQAG